MCRLPGSSTSGPYLLNGLGNIASVGGGHRLQCNRVLAAHLDLADL